MRAGDASQSTMLTRGLPYSHPVSRARREKGRQRVQLDPVVDTAHGRHLYAQPLRRMVRAALPPQQNPQRLTCTSRRASVVYSVQNWLGESEESQKSSGMPGYFGVGMSCKQEALSGFRVVVNEG